MCTYLVKSEEEERKWNVAAGRSYHAMAGKQEKTLLLSESKSLEKKHGRAESQIFDGRALVSFCWYLRDWKWIHTELGLRSQRSRHWLAGTAGGVR